MPVLVVGSIAIDNLKTQLEERREVNEAAAFDRACRLAASALGDTEFERLQAEGRLLRDEDIEAIAFRSGDA